VIGTNPGLDGGAERDRTLDLRIAKGERAKKLENPTTRGPIENAAKRYWALAEKFEAIRKGLKSAEP
jgi:hypothetical protein